MTVSRTNRAIAYHAIDTERAYQEHKWPDRPGLRSRTVDDFICDINEYTGKLHRMTGPNAGKLDAMRKVAALCVACFEIHGVPCHDGFPATESSMLDVVKQRTLNARNAGELSVKVSGDEFDTMEGHGLIVPLAMPGGAPSIPTYLGLVVDRLDA